MHTYTVALRISGADLDLAEVTSALKLKPTQTRVIGQKRDSSDFQWPESMWEYEARPSESKFEWNTLEAGLQAVVLTFASREKQLRIYKQRFKVILWCGHFSSSFGGGPTLSPQILISLADLGVELKLEAYISDEPTP
ncbi:MAG TPA: DUF4279 domain-containing protein [Candidatus Acidoferrales bacterium]|nr:DUF4279 domain-containing protein [Candidatus Acidoferrales bacterium]